METLQIQSTISKEWTNTFKKNNYSSPALEIKKNIYINKSKLEIEIGHLIIKFQLTLKTITAWEMFTQKKG